MCEGSMPGFIGRQRIYARSARANRKDAGQCSCHQPEPRKTPTERAQGALAVIGGVCMASAVGTGAAGRALGLGAEVVLIAVAVVLALALAGAGWWLVRRVRSLREPVVVPVDWQRPRTTVTGVQVRALEPGRSRPGLAAVPRDDAARLAARKNH